jgi:hypothetical protein
MISFLPAFFTGTTAGLRRLRRSFAVFLALLASVAGAAEPPPPLASLTYSGDQSALEDLDRDITAAGRDAGKLAALQASLLAILRRSDATFAARQAVCQRLGLVFAQSAPQSAADAYKPLDTMLLDARDSDLARLALDAAPGAAVDSLYIGAVGKAKGLTRIALIGSIATRRIEAAVPTLTKLLAVEDAPTAAAAARALGEIGTLAAESALRAADALPAAVRARARLQAAARLPAAEASRIVSEVEADTSFPTALRASAFRQALDLAPQNAATRLVDILSGNDWTYKQVALESLTDALPADRVSLLAARLASWDEPTQAAVLAAFARSGSALAVPAAMAAAKLPSAEVRGAATAALGFLPGNRDIVTLLTKLAAGDGDEAKSARQSLTRLTGPEVSAAILAGAERGETARRVVSLELLALRNQTEALPFLLRCRRETDAVIRAAAVGALGDLAPFSELRAVLDWAIAATDETEQSRALRAVVNVTRRNPDASARGQAVFAALESAPPDVAVRLLPALARLGGDASAACAARLAVRNESKVATAAAAALDRWTDGMALPALATVVETAALPAVRDSARKSALQFLERNREAWQPATTDTVARLLAATKSAPDRKQLVALLARANDQPALQLVESLQTDAALAAETRYAAGAIAAALAGPPKLRAAPASGATNAMDRKTSTRWSAPCLGEEWIEIDFRRNRPFRRLTFDQTGRGAEFPEHYEVHVTDDPKVVGPVVIQGQGQRNKTVLDLPAGTQGRYVIVRNTAAREETPWTICELYVD